MIDGIVIKTEIKDYTNWQENMPFEMHTPINVNDGFAKSTNRIDATTNKAYTTIKHTGKFGAYFIEVTEVLRANRKPRYYLRINGSLHKNKFNGENYQRFYQTDVCTEIENLCSVLQIDSKKARIANLEFGVNIDVDFKPHIFLQRHLINYQHKPFNQYAPDKENRRLGYDCRLKQYWVKCYDKGLQYYLSNNLMRFELKFKVMQILNKDYNIKFLSDLTHTENVYNLKKLLLRAWKDVLLFEDLKIPEVVLSSTQEKVLIHGNNPKYWETLNNADNRKALYQREKLRELISKYGKNHHEDILMKIQIEWELLSKPRLLNFIIKVNDNNLQLV